MTTAKELYMDLLPHALAAYAAKTSDMESAKQMARALSEECVSECMRLGILEESGYVSPRADVSMVPGTAGLPTFAASGQHGGGATPLVPLGTPQQPVQHYNHVSGGMQVVPPAGAAYEPPVQAGVMGTVTQAPTPQGYSALGMNGVISHPEQRPNGKDVIVAPGNQSTIQQPGNAGSMFVPERIVR